MTLIDQVRSLTSDAQKKHQQDEQIEIFNKEILNDKISKDRFEEFKKEFPIQVINSAKQGYTTTQYLVYSYENHEPEWVNEFFKLASDYLHKEGFFYIWGSSHERDRGWIRISWK